MTVLDTSTETQTESISFELDLRHPPEKVWRALTEPKLLAEWLLPAIDYRLEPGAAFTFRTEPVGGWDGIVQCRITDVVPQRRLSYDWGVGDMATVVTFTLTPTPAGTRLSLVQSGFRPDQKKNRGGARYGWRMMGGKLIDLLERTA
jgi:uncharacterized protein YndB with AHSA1/START domain